MDTPQTTPAAVMAPILLPDKTSRKKIRRFMAGGLDASNTTASITETNHQEDCTGIEKLVLSTSTTTQHDHRIASTTTTTATTSSPSRGSGNSGTSRGGVKRNNSAGSHRLSYVQIHSSSSIKGVNASDFTIDKLRFSSLGRLYGRDDEINHLKSIICMRNDLLKKKSNDYDDNVLVSGAAATTTITTTISSSSNKKVGFRDDNDTITFSSSAPPKSHYHHHHHNCKQLIMISGEAGCGKSVLALEAISLIREQRGFFLSGKYDQNNHDEPRKPFAAVATALQSLCEDLVLHKRSQKEEEAGVVGRDDSTTWYAAAANENQKNTETKTKTTTTTTTTTGCHRWTFKFTDFEERMAETFETEEIQLLNTIIPSLRKVIDVEYTSSDPESSGEFIAAPQVTEENPQSSREFQNSQEQHDQEEGITTMFAFGGVHTSVSMEDYAEHKVRIQGAFKRFLKLLCTFGPLCLYLDDVQWIDSPSLELLDSLIQDRETPALTIISSYRDDEIDDSHIWHTKIQSLEEDAKELNLKIHKIQLGNLTVDHICALLEDLISMSPDETRPLAECIHTKTGGNALYVKEFLLSLRRDELLTFEFRLMRWYYDVEEIRVNAKATDNVVALLNKKIEELPPMFSRLLPRVACLGCRFSYTMLDVVAEDCISDEEAEEARKLLASIRGGASGSNNMDYNGSMKAEEGAFVSIGTDDEVPSQINTSEAEEPSEDGEVLNKKQPDRTRVSINEQLENDASSSSRTKAEVLIAVCEESGLLTACAQGWFQWEHDKVQEAAWMFVNEEDFPAFQFDVGKLLLKDLPADNLSEALFVVTSLLNSFAESSGDEEMKIRIAELNCRSSASAFQSSAFESAAEFSQKGIALLPADQFTSHYSLALDLHQLAAESLFSVGNYTKAKEKANNVIQLDTELLDKRRAYKAYILSLAGQGLVTEAKDLTVEVLGMLGVKFPKRMRQMHILAGVMQLTGTVKKMTDKIDKLKPCTDQKKIWALDFLDRLVTYSFQAGDPDLLSLTMMKGTKLTAKWGISNKSGPLLASAALLLVIVGNYEGAKKYAERALKHANRATESRIRLITYRHVLHYQISTTVCKKAQMQGYYAGMKTGDLESAFWCCYGYCDDQMMSGVNLSIVVQDFAMYEKQVSQYQHVMTHRCFKLGWQCAVNLIKGGNGKDILTGDVMNEAELIAEIERDKSDGQTMYALIRFKIMGCFWFKEFDEVVRLCEEWGFHKGTLEKAVPGLHMTACVYFHCALSCLSVARTRKESKKGKHMKMAAFFLSRIKDGNRKGCPNTQHFQSLIQAEFLTFKSDNGEAKRIFENSIHTSGRLGITHDQALAHERLAENCKRLGYENDAKYHFDRALELFKDWGAHARADLLEQDLSAPARVISKQVSGDVSTLSSGGISGLTGPTTGS